MSNLLWKATNLSLCQTQLYWRWNLEKELNNYVQKKQKQYGYRIPKSFDKPFDVTDLYREYREDKNQLQDPHAATTESTGSFSELSSSEWENVYWFRVVYILRRAMTKNEKNYLRKAEQNAEKIKEQANEARQIK